ncbi:MAG: organomercurial lyase [Acidimicrobiia bacterium]
MNELEASGDVRSRDIHSGRPLGLTFTEGTADETEAVVFVAGDAGDDCFVVERWCPTVNFFTDRRSAEAWAAHTGATGEIADIATVAEACSGWWASLLEMSSPRRRPE